MAENLNIGTMIDYSIQNQHDNGIIEKFCPGGNSNFCNTYGGIYQWDEAMQYVTTPGTQGICPAGWHIPTDSEWKTMEMYLGMSQSDANGYGWRGTDEGGKLKEAGTSHWISPNNGATNSSGFTALPSGYMSPLHQYSGITAETSFWTSDEIGGTNAWYRNLNTFDKRVKRFNSHKASGFSVRCVK